MMPLDYVVAVALLTAPTSGGCDLLAPEHTCVMRTIREVALRWELLDPREASVVLHQSGHFGSDLGLLRRRYVRLATAPLIDQATRFPAKEVALERLAFNRAYHRTLKATLDTLGPARGVGDAVRETEQLYKLWDLLRDASSDCYYITARRESLAALRAALGEEAFWLGVMPPHVPIWRFTHRD